MAPVRTRALVLRVFPYSETSKVVRLLTELWGTRSAIAKGARRPRSRYAALLEPFTEGEALLYLRENRDLHTLGAFDLLRSRQRVGHDLHAFAGASLMAELLLHAATEEPNPDLFHAARETLDALVDGEPAERTVLAGLWRVLGLLGFAVQADICVGCGRTLELDDPARFDPEAGGAACVVCRPAGRLLQPETRGELARLSTGKRPLDPVAAPRLQRLLLRAFLRGQFQGAEFRSLGMFMNGGEA